MSISLLFLVPLVIVSLLMAPFIPVYRKKTTGKKIRGASIFNLLGFFGACALFLTLPVGDMVVFAAETSEAVGAAAAVSVGAGLGYLAAALAAGLSSLGAGIAVAAAAPAAIGAASEDASSFGKSLIFVALGEGVALYGLLIAILIINKL